MRENTVPVEAAICEAKAALLRGCPVNEVLDYYKVSPAALIVSLVSDIRGGAVAGNRPVFPDSPDAPSSAELGRVLVKAAQIVVGKKYRGKPPFGMTLGDVRQEIAVRAFPRIARWRPGKVPLKDFAYLSCYHALFDWLRSLSVPSRHKYDVLRLGMVQEYNEDRDSPLSDSAA